MVLMHPYLCLILLHTGFAEPACRQAAGELLPHHFTLTLLGRYLSVALSVGFVVTNVTAFSLRSVLSGGVRTFLMSILTRLPGVPPCQINQIFPSSTATSTSLATSSVTKMRPQFSQVYILSLLYFISMIRWLGIAE